jgi:hypothetical protein
MYQSRILETTENFRSEISYKCKSTASATQRKFRYQDISNFFQLLNAISTVLVVL